MLHCVCHFEECDAEQDQIARRALRFFASARASARWLPTALVLELMPNGQTEPLDISDGWVVYLHRSIRLVGADIVTYLLGTVAFAVYLT